MYNSATQHHNCQMYTLIFAQKCRYNIKEK